MILSKEFYDQCSPSYKKVIDKFEKDLADVENSNDTIQMKAIHICLTIVAFSLNYLTPKEYWQHCLDFIELLNEDAPDFDNYKKFCCRTIELAFFQFCCNKEWNTLYFDDDEDFIYLKPYDFCYLKLDHFHDFSQTSGTDIDERDLSYPHDKLKECLRKFEMEATKLPPKNLIKRYEKMVKLYPEIVAAEGDDEKWYKLLLQVGDNDYVKINIEYRLGQNLLNVNLWKIYIGFLKELGESSKLVHIYSNYCRFFLDDLEMKKEYKQALSKCGKIGFSWQNLFDFEDKNELKEEGEDKTQDSDSEEEPLPFDKKICLDFYKTYKHQNFSLPGPLVLYILKNAGHRVLQKLFFSCKYFFVNHPTPICYSLHTGRREFYKDESLTLKRYSKQESFPKNLYVTGNMFAGTLHAPYIDFLPKFYRCEAKYICFRGLNFSFDELKLLIGHGGVIQLDLENCKIKDEKGHFLDLEKIMAFLPNIERFSITWVKTNAKTGHALAVQKFNTKISAICVYQIVGVPFDVDELLKFLTANKDDKQCFLGCFSFNEKFDAVFVEKIKQVLDDYTHSHKFYGYINAKFYGEE